MVENVQERGTEFQVRPFVEFHVFKQRDVGDAEGRGAEQGMNSKYEIQKTRQILQIRRRRMTPAPTQKFCNFRCLGGLE